MAATEAHIVNQRGPVAVADMKARVAAGWTVDMLWDRMKAAENGGGYSYDYAEDIPQDRGVLSEPVLEELEHAHAGGDP